MGTIEGSVLVVLRWHPWHGTLPKRVSGNWLVRFVRSPGSGRRLWCYVVMRENLTKNQLSRTTARAALAKEFD